MTAEWQERATPDTWMNPRENGWTYDQVKDLDLPFDWELVDGVAEAGVPYYWRVERGQDGAPVVHEFWRDDESGVFAPPLSVPHRGKLSTDVPFPVRSTCRA